MWSHTDATLPLVLQSLQNPVLYPHPVTSFELIETHISWVLLTGDIAYKFKKPVNFGFLDFSSLEKRRYYCFQELTLNRLLAPKLYLDVIPIYGTADAPNLKGSGAVFEYAVKMREFPQSARLDRVLARGELERTHIENLTRQISAFHARIDRAAEESPWGKSEDIYATVKENLPIIRHLSKDFAADIDLITQWLDNQYQTLRPIFDKRRQTGFIRACHGDMHLENMALLENEIVIFDGIEFNDSFRWIDIASEIAFLIMDLHSRQKPQLAAQFLNAYLEQSGDYEGVTTLHFYLVYRALVRAKVAVLHLMQSQNLQEKQQLEQTCRAYIQLAAVYTKPPQPFLLILHGFSGAGKTTVSEGLLTELSAIRLRSDLERKRLFGLSPNERGTAKIYSAEAGWQTFQRLAELSRCLLQAGFPVIMDATFIKQTIRQIFWQIAQNLNLPFAILSVQTETTILYERVAKRSQENHDASDADAAVLRQQLQRYDPLTPEELSRTLILNTATPPNFACLAAELRALLHN